MTNKEMKELIQKQNKQISELISLVQELEKKDRPFPTYTPWRITQPYPFGNGTSTVPDFRDWPPRVWMGKDAPEPHFKNESTCIMDSCLGNEVTSSKLEEKENKAAEELSTIYSNAAIF